MKSLALFCLIFFAQARDLTAYDSIVVFNEIHYHPADDSSSEFVEFYNQNTVDVDLSNWRISGGIDFTFPKGTVIAGQSYLVVAASPASLVNAARISGVLGPFSGTLANKGETLRLRNLNDRIMDEVSYHDRVPWPVTPDGSGASLAKIKPKTTGGLPQNWQASPQNGGTPGAENFPAFSAEPATVTSSLIPLDATWRYLESGTDLGTNWASSPHPIGGDWKSGPGMLAYETPAIPEFLTDLARPSSNTPFVITYYFETEFEITPEQSDSLHAITLTHRIDDGAVFYLNGTEVLRDNMNGGPVTAATLAASSGDFTIEGPLQIPTASLQVGTNRISVEVHQGTNGSSDLVFGLEADLVSLLPDSSGYAHLRLSELAPAGGPDWWLEITNRGHSPTDLAGCLLATSGDPAMELALPAGIIDPGEYLVINAGALGFFPPSTERLFLYGPEKTTIIDGADLRNSPQARDFSRDTSEFFEPSLATPGAANTFDIHDEIVINEIMYHHRPQYARGGEPPAIQAIELFGYSQAWRYHESGGDLGSNWAKSPHPLGGDWLGGIGPLGWESTSSPPPVPLGTELSRPAFNTPFVVTHYFETEFNLTAAGLAGISGLQITRLIDDGSVIYLNGQEVERFNLSDGAINAATLSVDGIEASEESFTFAPDALVEGSNRISVEVHQESVGSSDVVMGLRLAALREIPSPNPPVDFTENSEEWIELYNRSSDPVDLSNWKFDRGIDFQLPSGTQLAGHGYLVVARDLPAFSAKHPGVNVLGDYAGTLSNSGELIRLVDSKGYPADEVTYYDGNPWPLHTDGGGSSLELLHPDTDNAAPDAWAASNHSEEAEWTSYTFTATAADPTFRPPQNGFHELRLGFLDRGELLLDDVSVVEDPNGSPRELIQNGSFDNGLNAWRLLGTHGESEIVTDGGNPVLKVIATSRMNYMNNLLETNLRSGGALVPIREGTEYQISFRAKWLKGSPQFRAELYYNKLAKTFILDQPVGSGTPGAVNSTFVVNPGPTFSEMSHDPPVPPVDTPVTVSARVFDPDGVASVQLHYAVSGENFQSILMGETSEQGIWSAQLPGQSRGTKTQFYLEATDTATNPATSAFPAAGADSRAMFQVEDGKSSETRQNLRLIMTNADSSALHRANDLLENRRLGCTVITNNDEIAYDCGVRLRGSMFSRRNPSSTGLNIRFPDDRLFRGVHKTVTTSPATRHEIIAKHIITQAGGLHDGYEDLAQLIHTTQNGVPVRLSMARFGSGYLNGLPGGKGAEGTVFKMEGIRVFQATDTGNPEGKKLPFPIGWLPTFDLADQGDDKEIYRHNIRINSNFEKDDYTDIIAMNKALSLTGPELETAVAETMNVDMWMRQFALLSLLGIGDTYTQGNPHNLNMYARPSDGRIEPIPWDWDFLFNRSTNSPLWGNRNLAKVIARPAYTRLFHGHLHNLINTTYNTDYMTPWLRHYGPIAGENYTGDSSYIRNRSNYVLSQLPTAVPFIITTEGGNNFAVDTPTVTLTGKAWIDVQKIRLNNFPEAIVPNWIDDETWTVSVPVRPGANPLTLTAVDYEGQDLGFDTITVTNTGTITPASSENLVISEIMYHPAGDAAHEYLELLNVDPSLSIDLTGVRFVEGIDFDFAKGFTLASGERVLIVGNLAAFISKYGSNLPITGVFANDTKLSNGGEELALIDAGGRDIARFTYGDSDPWPTLPDGNGMSLVLRNAGNNPDASLAENWRASSSPDGSPGRNDTSKFTGNPTADSDNDGITDLIEYALATDPLDPGSLPLLTVGRDAGGVFVSFEALATADDVLITPQISTDLDTWISSGSNLIVVPGTGGIETRIFRFDQVLGEPREFLRIQVRLK